MECLIGDGVTTAVLGMATGVGVVGGVVSDVFGVRVLVQVQALLFQSNANANANSRS